MKVLNKTKNTILAQRAESARTFWARLKGLIGQKNIGANEALIIPYCCSVHMFFMRFSIDVLFLDKNYRVVGCVKNLKPFRLSPIFPKAFYAIEIPAGKIVQTRTFPGDQIELIIDRS